MKGTVSFLLASILLMSSGTTLAYADEIVETPTEEEAASDTPEENLGDSAEEGPAIDQSETVEEPLIEEEVQQNLFFRTFAQDTEEPSFAFNSSAHDHEITFSGAAGFSEHELLPRLSLTAQASGTPTKARMYLARNIETTETPLSGKWFFVQLFDSDTHIYVCTLLTTHENGTTQARENFSLIPVGDASSVQLIEFDHLEGDCTLEEGRTYEVSMNYRVPGDPRWTNGAIYSRGSSDTDFFLQVTTTDFPEEEPACEEPCASNVLFLPGIKGSRLYVDNGSEEKVWDPIGEDDIRSLFLNENGKTLEEVYAKEGDIIDSVASFIDIYDGFITSMDTLAGDGTINDWKAASYDWRLSLEDIVNGGAERDGRIYYGEATSTPYIEQTLRALAASSKTGKVTVVAHSNGGLVAKALFEKLGPEQTAELVDNVVFVGVPQEGAPQAIGALLFGYKEGLPWWFPFLVSPGVAREFAEHSPMGYHLLPTQPYFDSISGDTAHSVIRFDDSYTSEVDSYGSFIDSFDELRNYLQANDGGRTKPSSESYASANVLGSYFLNYAEDSHASIDSWTPPDEVTLYQIAGWGEDTISGIEFYEECGFTCAKKYRPTFIEDGDGVVPVPSALMIGAENLNTKRLWLDLRSFGFGLVGNRDHGNLFEVSELEDYLSQIIQNTDSDELPNFIKTSQPPNTGENKKLRFFLHSPLTLEVKDSEGNYTGPTDVGEEEGIPGSEYGVFGDVQYISVPATGNYKVEMHATGEGVFSIDVQEEGDGVSIISTISNLPVSQSTFASFSINTGVEDISPLTIDKNGDGVTDIEVEFNADKLVTYVSTSEAGSFVNEKAIGLPNDLLLPQIVLENFAAPVNKLVFGPNESPEEPSALKEGLRPTNKTSGFGSHESFVKTMYSYVRDLVVSIINFLARLFRLW